MKLWITGANGFVGGHLEVAARELGYELLLTDLASSNLRNIISLDICDEAMVRAFANEHKPDACIHLAGIAFVPDAAKNPDLLENINVTGALNVGKTLWEANPNARLLFVSTAQVYGYKYREEPMCPSDDLRPNSPYAESKAKAEKLLLDLAREKNYDLCIARPGNHTGPGQSPKFVIPSFAQAVCRVKYGLAKEISVGNLDCERDFTDVRDVVRAYLTILANGKNGGIYNISAGNHLSIRSILEKIMAIANVSAPIRIDETLFRQTDAMPPLSTAYIRSLGWEPKIPFDKTLRDVIADVK